MPVPVDVDGMSVVHLRKMEHPPKLICVTPSHHDRLGYVMSMERSQELGEYAREGGAVILEDSLY